MYATVCMVSVPACRAPGARSCTVPPTLVCTAIRRSAWPLLRMSRYATVVPDVVGCGTYALVMAIDDVASAVPHPVTPSAARSTAQAMPKTDVSLRITQRYRVPRRDDPLVPLAPIPAPPRCRGGRAGESQGPV